MLRFKESQLWKDLTFHFRCKNLINLSGEIHKALLANLEDYKKECISLRTKVEEDKAVFDAMDKQHIKDKEAMALEIETMRSDHLKLLGDFRLAEVEIKATNKHAYDANKATENLKLERQRLIDIVDGLKEDFKQYKNGTPAITAQGETLSARIESNDKKKSIVAEIEEPTTTILQEASALSENAKQIIKDINEMSSSPSPLTAAIAEAYLFEKNNEGDVIITSINADTSPECFNRKKKRKGNR